MMDRPELRVYALHAAFWLVFVIARRAFRADAAPATPAATPAAPTAPEEKIAPYSRALLALHMVAFGFMYFGLADAVLPNRVPNWFFGQRAIGAVLVGLGSALMVWALAYFRSWRFRAKLDAGHELATGGPFRLLRHPLYMGLNFLALGTALWCPTPLVWIGFALMILGSDLRGRAEEGLLTRTFGDAYRVYSARTKRFIPGIY